MQCLYFVGILWVTSLLGWVNFVNGVTSGTGYNMRGGNDTVEGKLECYICSWSVTANVTNNEDNCSPQRFIPEAAKIRPCEHGCQTVSYRNAKNEGLRNFYRNCLKIEPGQKPVDRCIPTKQIPAYGLEDKCECLTSLCNQSPILRPPHVFFKILPPGTAALVLTIFASLTIFS